ncbi:oxygen-insensitive NADPH nitroreductase [Alphaproteobacteria bacterium]|nr:oxygen-insensitive NADPH nitroreductase [Alphaproteobacteria bacterium]
MNPTIELLKSHRSIRKFADHAISEGLLHELVKSGQAAATSSFLQGVTIVRVTDREKRKAFVEISGGQKYVESAAEFLIFCADLSRSSRCCEWHDAEAAEGFTEQFIIATVDVGLFAQNLVVAAQSEGLGICYIGGIRNNPAKATELLELPMNVYPVFGLCLGYPDQDPEAKPRLPVSVVLKENVYNDKTDKADIERYDDQVRDYYRTRTGGKKEMSWSEQMSGLLGKESRPHMRGFLKDQGFEMK